MGAKVSRFGGALCHYCLEEPATTDDHIVPRAIIPKRLKLSGWMLMLNRVPACMPCNNKKGSFRADCRCPQCIKAWAVYTEQLHLCYMPDIVSIEFITTRVNGNGNPHLRKQLDFD